MLNGHLGDRNDKHGTEAFQGFSEPGHVVESDQRSVLVYLRSPRPWKMSFIRLLIGDRTETEWPAPDSVRGFYDRWLMGMRVHETLIREVEGEGEDGVADDDYLEGCMAGRRWASLIWGALAGE